MRTFTYTITDPLGIHARPAGLLVKAAGEFSATITLAKDGKTGDAKKIFNVMAMGVKKGDTITVTIDGSDEAEAETGLKNFFETTL